MKTMSRAVGGLGVAGLLVGFVAGVCLRAGFPDAEPADTGQALAGVELGWSIDVNNELCPIMGGTAKEDVFTTWQGLKIRFCCSGCDEDFLAEPEETLRNMGVDVEKVLRDVKHMRTGALPKRATLPLDPILGAAGPP